MNAKTAKLAYRYAVLITGGLKTRRVYRGLLATWTGTPRNRRFVLRRQWKHIVCSGTR